MRKPIDQRISDALKESVDLLDLVLSLHRDGYPLRPGEIEEIEYSVNESKQLLAAEAHARKGNGDV